MLKQCTAFCLSRFSIGYVFNHNKSTNSWHSFYPANCFLIITFASNDPLRPNIYTKFARITSGQFTWMEKLNKQNLTVCSLGLYLQVFEIYIIYHLKGKEYKKLDITKANCVYFFHFIITFGWIWVAQLKNGRFYFNKNLLHSSEERKVTGNNIWRCIFL